MNVLNNFDNTDREYSLAITDDLIRFWRSKVKVIAGRRGHIFVNTNTSYLMNYLRDLGDETYRE